MSDINALVTAEVEKRLSDPLYLQNAVLQLTNRLIEKDREIEALESAKNFYERVTSANDWMEMSDAVKVLGFKGYGRNNTFALLREKNIMRYNNVPHQAYIDRGYFRVVEEPFEGKYGDTVIYRKTVVSQKGLEFLRKIIEAEGSK